MNNIQKKDVIEGHDVLMKNLEQLHTTEMGVQRIKRNLALETEDVVNWCRTHIKSASTSITRKGKNWYVETGYCVITVNAHSYTIITAHKRKNSRAHL